MRYIVKIPSMGGWSKSHIWKVSDPTDYPQTRIRTLCSAGGRAAPNPAWIPECWIGNQYPLIPASTMNPLEGKSHECLKCSRVWALNIRDKETTNGR